MSRRVETEGLIAARQAGEQHRVAAAADTVSALEGHALWAGTYDLDPNPLLALEERELEPLLPDVKGKDVIDVACGTARWLEKLLSRGARAGVGVDLSAEMLAQAAKKPSVKGRLGRADILALPFHSRISDLAICSFAIGYVSNLGDLARELARIAHPRADLFVTDFHPAAPLRGWKRGFCHAGKTVEIASVSHSARHIRAAFEFEGFELVRSHEPCLGEPERPIFEQAGKSHLFDAACQAPAIFICQFKLVNHSLRKKEA